jgi:hypothetical protein
MPVEQQFTAKGPAQVGFQTRPNVTSIERGVHVEGSKKGVLASGPVGVEGHGEVAGVQGVGQENGCGGAFKSAAFRSAQLNVSPHRTESLGQPVHREPAEFPATSQTEGQLPSIGRLGDLWMSSTSAQDAPPRGEGGPQPQCHLWLCVRAGNGPGKPLWAQVLLGTPLRGRRPGGIDP